MKTPTPLQLLGKLIAGALLIGTPITAFGQYTLQLLHASDLEGGVEAIDRAPNFAAIVDALEEEHPNTILLSAGDNYIPGPFFSAASDGSVEPVLQSVYDQYYGGITENNLEGGVGRIDLTIMNVLGFDASALGNHEFDAGTSTVADIIGAEVDESEVNWIGNQFPYLSANLGFSGDGNLSGLFTSDLLNSNQFESDPNTLLPGEKKSIAPATLIERGGELIGVVGATTPLLQSISSPGDTEVKEPGSGTNNMSDLASILQPVIDDLMDAGANKIILVSHLQQIMLEEELAGLLNGVDIIVAGGSDSVLASEDDDLLPEDQDNVYADYPLISSNADSDPVLIVSTNGEYSYVGRLVVDFTPSGVIDVSSIADASGPYISDEETVIDLWGSVEAAFTEGTKGNLVQQLTDAVLDVVIEKDGNTFGKTAVYLDGRRSQVRSEETNLGNLTADANLWAARNFDPTTLVSIKNGGGIRSAIGEVVQLPTEEFAFLPPQANPVADKETGEVSHSTWRIACVSIIILRSSRFQPRGLKRFWSMV